MTGVRSGSSLVGHPDFNTLNLYTSGDIGQGRHGLVVTVTEIMRKEEVAILFIVRHVHLEGSGLGSTFRRDTLGGGFLLRKYRLEFQATELHIRTYTKQTRSTFYQRVVGGECDISCLYQFDNLVRLTLVFQFQVLCVKIKCGIGIVVQIHVHLIAYPTIHVQIDFLIEIE